MPDDEKYTTELPSPLVDRVARAVREEIVRQFRDDERGKCSAGTAFYEEHIAPDQIARVAIATTDADLNYGEGHFDGVREERARCARFVEEECIYMVGRIQAAAIARKIRSAG